jgi:hypothetical protein
VAGAEHHKLEPRARSEGMAARRGVWQVAAYALPPDCYVLGMGVPRTLTFVCGRLREIPPRRSRRNAKVIFYGEWGARDFAHETRESREMWRGGDLGRQVVRPHLMAAGLLGGVRRTVCDGRDAARPRARVGAGRSRQQPRPGRHNPCGGHTPPWVIRRAMRAPHTSRETCRRNRRASSLTKAGAGVWGRTRGRAVCRRPESAGTRIMRRPVAFQARVLKRKDARGVELAERTAWLSAKVPRRRETVKQSPHRAS